MKNKKHQLLLSSVGLLGIIFIVAGVTYAFFSYAKVGSKVNSISSGDVKFLYTENPTGGRGIVITDAMPMADSIGKLQTGTDSYFDFKVTAVPGKSVAIPYTVTARVSSDSTLDPKVVKVWLSDQSNTEIEPVKYFDATDASTRTDVLQKYTGVSYASKYNERILYSDTVPNDLSEEYIKNFRLRIWIDSDTDFSENVVPAHCSVAIPVGTDNTKENCEQIQDAEWIEESTEYPYNNKTFKITVNVYANGQVVSQDIDASQIGYYNSLSTKCTSEENQTIECALDELTEKLGG